MEYKHAVMRKPKDKNGKQYQKGDLFIESHSGDAIWDGRGKVKEPSIGYFTDEEIFDGGWLVCTFKPGVAICEGGRVPLYISAWDGEYIGKWEKTIIVGHLDYVGEKLF